MALWFPNKLDINSHLDYYYDTEALHRCRHLDVSLTLLHEHGLARNPTLEQSRIL